MAEDKAKKVGPIRLSEQALLIVRTERARRSLQDPSSRTWTYAEIVDELLSRAANAPPSEFPTKDEKSAEKVVISGTNRVILLMPEEEQWLALARRALRVQEPHWRRMLDSVKFQLETIGDHAQSESENRNEPENAGMEGIAGVGGTGAEPKARTTRRRRKTG